MKMLKAAFGGMLLLGSAYVHAQTADEVVSKHIEAVGGNAVITSLKSQIIEGELIVPGALLTTKVFALFGVGVRSEASIEGQEIIECITKTGGWTINPMQGMVDAAALPEDRVKSAQGELEAGGRLFRYKEKGSSVELAGNENVNGVNAFKLKLKESSGNESVYYIDPTTYYIIKAETPLNMGGQALTITTTFSNFKKTDVGYVMPFTRVRDVNGTEITNNITKVEFNKEIDQKIFEMPK